MKKNDLLCRICHLLFATSNIYCSYGTADIVLQAILTMTMVCMLRKDAKLFNILVIQSFGELQTEV